MGETKPKNHNTVVLEVGQALLKSKGLDTVQADHMNKCARAKHGFKRKLVLRVKPPEVLAPFVPTLALFYPRLVFPNCDWKTPDLAVKRNGLTYVLEVYNARDNYTSVARKIERVIANSKKHNIVGMAVIEKGAPYTSKAEQYRSEEEQKKAEKKEQRKANKAKKAADQLERVRGTFHRLFGEPRDALCPDKCRTYLEPLFLHPAVRALYGKINWDAVLEMSIKDNNWAKTLCKHVDAAFKAKTLLAQPAPTS